jgi:hypothetical protein
VQAFALVASQDAIVTEQAPSLVLGIRRLRSASALASIIPSSALLGVAVSVAPDADASSAFDVGLVIVVHVNSPFADVGSTALISPVVTLVSFDADKGTPKPTIRNVIEAKFPVTQSSHDTRIVVNAVGQRKAEGCVAYDGSSWIQSCAIGAYSSLGNSMTCTCNATASTLAIAVAEFIVDCSGAFGGTLVLDACNTCGGTVIDPSKCSTNSDSPLNIGAIAGAIVGGCLVSAISIYVYFRKKQQAVDAHEQTTTLPVPPSESHLDDARGFRRHVRHSPSQSTDASAMSLHRDYSPERILPGSPLKSHTLSEYSQSRSMSALNQSSKDRVRPLPLRLPH